MKILRMENPGYSPLKNRSIRKLRREELIAFSNKYMKGEELWAGYQGYGSRIIFLRGAKILRNKFFDLSRIDTLLQSAPEGHNIITDLTNFISLCSEENKTTFSTFLKIVEALNVGIPRTTAQNFENIIGYLNKGPFKFKCIEEVYFIENFPGENLKAGMKITLNSGPSLADDAKNFFKWLTFSNH